MGLNQYTYAQFCKFSALLNESLPKGLYTLSAKLIDKLGWKSLNRLLSCIFRLAMPGSCRGLEAGMCCGTLLLANR